MSTYPPPPEGYEGYPGYEGQGQPGDPTANSTDGVSMPICAWADGSSFTGVIFLGQAAKSTSATFDLTADASTTLALRTAMEVKK